MKNLKSLFEKDLKVIDQVLRSRAPKVTSYMVLMTIDDDGKDAFFKYDSNNSLTFLGLLELLQTMIKNEVLVKSEHIAPEKDIESQKKDKVVRH